MFPIILSKIDDIPNGVEDVTKTKMRRGSLTLKELNFLVVHNRNIATNGKIENVNIREIKANALSRDFVCLKAG